MSKDKLNNLFGLINEICKEELWNLNIISEKFYVGQQIERKDYYQDKKNVSRNLREYTNFNEKNS